MPDYTQHLRQADIFYHFSPPQLEQVAQLCRERTCQLGETIFTEGSSSNELYIIVHGEVNILVDPNLVSDKLSTQYTPAIIATLRRGQSFGEMALVDQGLRSATARTAEHQTRLLILPRDRLLQLCEADPQFGFRLMYNLAADLALKVRNSDLLIREELLTTNRR